MNIAVCDDESQQLQQAVELMQAYLHSHPALSGQIHPFESGQELLSKVENSGGLTSTFWISSCRNSMAYRQVSVCENWELEVRSST